MNTTLFQAQHYELQLKRELTDSYPLQQPLPLPFLSEHRAHFCVRKYNLVSTLFTITHNLQTMIPSALCNAAYFGGSPIIPKAGTDRTRVPGSLLHNC